LRQTAVQNAIPNATWSVPEISDYRAASKTVDGFAEFSALDFNMLGHGEPRRVRSGIVSGNYFDVLGLRPVLGRLTQPSDDGRNADAVMGRRFSSPDSCAGFSSGSSPSIRRRWCWWRSS
jgi:hypothetical protein